MAQSRRYYTVDFGHVERAVEGIGGRARVQRAFVLERKKPVCLPVTQGGEYFCLSNFMRTCPESVTFKPPTLAWSVLEFTWMIN